MVGADGADDVLDVVDEGIQVRLAVGDDANQSARAGDGVEETAGAVVDDVGIERVPLASSGKYLCGLVCESTTGASLRSSTSQQPAGLRWARSMTMPSSFIRRTAS